MSTLDAGLVRRLLQQQFTGLDATRIDYLNEGCDSIAFEVDGCFVFRFPKRADVEGQMSAERAVLETLAAADPPVAIPNIQYEGQPSSAFEFRFAGYPKIPGRPAMSAALSFDRVLDLAPMIGRFLSWLHAVPVESVAHVGIETQDVTMRIDEARREALEEFPRVLAVAGPAPIEPWREWIQESIVAGGNGESPSVLLHNDFAAEHVLIAESGDLVTGVIDWSDAALGDRALDFAGIFHWGGQRLMEAVLEAYDCPADARALRRARFMAACRGALDVSFGVEHDRPEYIEAGLTALSLNAGP